MLRRGGCACAALAICGGCTWDGYDGSYTSPPSTGSGGSSATSSSGRASSSGAGGEVSSTIIGSDGGELVSGDGWLRIEVPPDAVSRRTVVTIALVSPPPTGSFFGHAYEVTAEPPFEGAVAAWLSPQGVGFPYEQGQIARESDGTLAPLALVAARQLAPSNYRYLGVTRELGTFALVQSSPRSPWIVCEAGCTAPSACPQCCPAPCTSCGGLDNCFPCGVSNDPYAYMDCLDGCADAPVNACTPCARACCQAAGGTSIKASSFGDDPQTAGTASLSCQCAEIPGGEIEDDALAACLEACLDDGQTVSSCGG